MKVQKAIIKKREGGELFDFRIRPTFSAFVERIVDEEVPDKRMRRIIRHRVLAQVSRPDEDNSFRASDGNLELVKRVASRIKPWLDDVDTSVEKITEWFTGRYQYCGTSFILTFGQVRVAIDALDNKHNLTPGDLKFTDLRRDVQILSGVIRVYQEGDERDFDVPSSLWTSWVLDAMEHQGEDNLKLDYDSINGRVYTPIVKIRYSEEKRTCHHCGGMWWPHCSECFLGEIDILKYVNDTSYLRDQLKYSIRAAIRDSRAAGMPVVINLSWDGREIIGVPHSIYWWNTYVEELPFHETGQYEINGKVYTSKVLYTKDGYPRHFYFNGAWIWCQRSERYRSHT